MVSSAFIPKRFKGQDGPSQPEDTEDKKGSNLKEDSHTDNSLHYREMGLGGGVQGMCEVGRDQS